MSVIYNLIKWALNMVLRFLRVLYRVIAIDFFKAFNITSICLSLTLIGTWFSIMLSEMFVINADGSIGGTDYSHIDLISSLSEYYDTYTLYSSINSIIIFWRIL